jgi:hypothetical protein
MVREFKRSKKLIDHHMRQKPRSPGLLAFFISTTRHRAKNRPKTVTP